MSRTLRILALTLGFWSWACGGSGDASEEAGGDTVTAGDSSRPGEPPGGRDLSTVDVCALVPADAVAAAMGEASSSAPADYDPGFDGKGCRYKSGMRYAEVSLLPPDHFEFKRGMTPKEQLHPVEGIGDAAYWQRRSDRMEILVLKDGDATIWVRFQDRGKDTREEDARRLAVAVLARLE